MSRSTKSVEPLSAKIGPLTSDRGRQYRIMQLFADTPKTETAFYLQFQQLAWEDRHFLQSFYSLDDCDFSVFKKITRFWRVRTA